MKVHNTIKIIDFHYDDVPAVIKELDNHITYRDTVLEEHLISIDFADDETIQDELSDKLKEFMKEVVLLGMTHDATYFRITYV